MIIIINSYILLCLLFYKISSGSFWVERIEFSVSRSTENTHERFI